MGQVFAVFIVVVGVAEIVACIKHIQNGYLPTWAPRRVITDPKWRQKQLSCDIINSKEDEKETDLSEDKDQLENSQNNISGISQTELEVRKIIEEAERIINKEYIPDNIELDDHVVNNKLGPSSIENEIEKQTINQITKSINNNNVSCEMVSSNNIEISDKNTDVEPMINDNKIITVQYIDNLNNSKIDNITNNNEDFQLINKEQYININNENALIKSNLPEHEFINEENNSILCNNNIMPTTELESDTGVCKTTNNVSQIHNDSYQQENASGLENKEVITNEITDNKDIISVKTKNEIYESVINSLLLNTSEEGEKINNNLLIKDLSKSNLLPDNDLNDKIKNESRNILKEDAESCEISKNKISAPSEETKFMSCEDPSNIQAEIIQNDDISTVYESSSIIKPIKSEILNSNIFIENDTLSDKRKDNGEYERVEQENKDIVSKINKNVLLGDGSNDIESEVVSSIDVNGNCSQVPSQLVEESFEHENALEQQVETSRESQITIPQDIETSSRKEKIINFLSGIITNAPVEEKGDELKNNTTQYKNASEVTDIVEQITETREEITRTEITGEDIRKTNTSPNKLTKQQINQINEQVKNGTKYTEIPQSKPQDNLEIIDDKIKIAEPNFESQTSVPFCDSPNIIPDESRLTIKNPPPFEPSTPPPSPVGDEITPDNDGEARVINSTPEKSKASSQQQNKSSIKSQVQDNTQASTSKIEFKASEDNKQTENSKTNENVTERVTIPTEMKNTLWLIFSGEYTKAMSKDWHSGHFCCWQCDESLTGQRYVLRDDHPYCIKCYESVFANTCEECNKTIGIDSKDLSYKDKHWHEVCFLCTKCRVSLVDKQFGSKADKIYCGNCYDSQFASRCDGCGEIFRAGTKKMEYKTRQWHEKCFCCCVCKSAIGTKSFIPREQEIYCAGCYEEKFATRCVKCNKIITTGGVTYKNEPWHRECFTCTNCNTSLAGQRFTSRDEKPYCAECFGELFAKRCTSCSKPITGIGGTRFISFEDRHWHNDCFICATCKTSLVGRGFITDADDIICPECAKQKLM